jgi:hypothetical protein
MRWLWQSPLVRLGLAAACLAVALLVGALREALRVDDVNGKSGSVSLPGVTAASARSNGYSLDRVLSAVSKDPFHPERRRPAVRFQMPEDLAAASAQREASQATEASLRLVGTAVGADGGGFAMCAWQGGNPRIVRIGERVGEWTLQRVWQGAAEFVTPAGSTITVRVPKAGA